MGHFGGTLMEKKELLQLSAELFNKWLDLVDAIKVNSSTILHSSGDEEISNWFITMAVIEKDIKDLKQRSLLLFRLRQRFQEETSKNDIQSGVSNE